MYRNPRFAIGQRYSAANKIHAVPFYTREQKSGKPDGARLFMDTQEDIGLFYGRRHEYVKSLVAAQQVERHPTRK